MFLGNLGIKIFYVNNDVVINEWVFKIIGKVFINVSFVNVGKGYLIGIL